MTPGEDHRMTSPDLSWVPSDACTLPTEERPLRVAEFATLFAETLTRVERYDDAHARLCLAGAPGLDARVRDLVARESRCCSFFDFTVAPAAQPGSPAGPVEVHLDIRVPPSRAGVLAALVEAAEAARAPYA